MFFSKAIVTVHKKQPGRQVLQLNHIFYAFCGHKSPSCCNPSHMAILSDGSFVTCEKGIERIKIHTQNGDYKCVVAAPDSFDKDTVGLDVAVDGNDRIFVLDPVRAVVRVFVKQ